MEKLLTIIIITKDEEAMLPDCIKTLSFADELLVIDTGSIDKTVSIAKKAGARVLEYHSGKTFSDWRNFGLRHAKGKWVLYIDADERVSDKLQQEIVTTIKETDTLLSWYAIPRSNIIWNKEFRHGGWWPDYVKRLFLKDKLEKWYGDLHEEPKVKGAMGKLVAPLTHIKHETLSEMIKKTNSWSAIEGKLMFDANHPPMNIPRFATAMFREFWKRMVIQMAFLDGTRGIMMAMYQVFSRFVSYAKLWEMQVAKQK